MTPLVFDVVVCIIGAAAARRFAQANSTNVYMWGEQTLADGRFYPTRHLAWYGRLIQSFG